jgi:hypothetical protein
MIYVSMQFCAWIVAPTSRMMTRIMVMDVDTDTDTDTDGLDQFQEKMT